MNDEGEELQIGSANTTPTVSIDAEAYEEIKLDYQGQWYRVVRTDDGLELEEVDDG